MVEISITLADATLVHGLMVRLRRLFRSSSVTYDGGSRKVTVAAEWASGSVVTVVDAVQEWLDGGDAGPAEVAIGDRRSVLVASSSLRADLAAVAAVARSAGEAPDPAALAARICESVAEGVRCARVTLLRHFPDAGRLELLAAYGPPLHAATTALAAPEGSLFRSARDLRAPVFAAALRGPGGRETAEAGVVVALSSGRHCLGFLTAGAGDAPLDLVCKRALLATLGDVIAGLLQQAIDHEALTNRLRLKSEFIALASHELRTPAAAVYGSAMTLDARAGTLGARQKRDLVRLLAEQATRLDALVRQLLDLSRLEASSLRIKPAALAVRERTEEILRGFASAQAGGVELRIDPSLRVPADAEAFDHIVSNLVANAFRYGRPPVTVSAAANDRHFRLVVEDRGRGVPREFAPHLFERFRRATTGGPGAGLGLSIAQAYAHAHGGQVAYADADPHGARFELVVPLHRTAAGAPRAPAETREPMLRSGQRVSLNGRAASFCYTSEPGCAVIRYDDETGARVVPLHKLSPAPSPPE